MYRGPLSAKVALFQTAINIQAVMPKADPVLESRQVLLAPADATPQTLRNRTFLEGVVVGTLMGLCLGFLASILLKSRDPWDGPWLNLGQNANSAFGTVGSSIGKTIST